MGHNAYGFSLRSLQGTADLKTLLAQNGKHTYYLCIATNGFPDDYKVNCAISHSLGMLHMPRLTMPPLHRAQAAGRQSLPITQTIE